MSGSMTLKNRYEFVYYSGSKGIFRLPERIFTGNHSDRASTLVCLPSF